MKQTYRRYLSFVTSGGGLALALAAGLAPAAAADSDTRSRYKFSVSTNGQDAAACRQSLHKIHEAISAFTNDHQRLPHWLSELSGEYLDAKLLVCPYVKRLGDLQTWRYGLRGDVFEDPKKSTSYSYEFCNKKLILWTGVEKTWADYKRCQMEFLGSRGNEVPIVRCFAHDPPLNLAIGGEIYESGTAWEDRYPSYSHHDWHPESLFYHLPPQTSSKPFPERAPNVPARCLDLTRQYNAYLDQDWLPIPLLPNNHLSELSHGNHEFKGVPFDVRGLIQLKSAELLAPYPIVAEGIKVDALCRKIHFLHAVHHDPGTRVDEGRKVASYVAHYQSRAQAEIPILYGRDVKNWWYDPVIRDDTKAQVVWEGDNQAATTSNHKIRLFLSSWINPWKNQPIEAISLVSAMSEAAPFVVAITLE